MSQDVADDKPWPQVLVRVASDQGQHAIEQLVEPIENWLLCAGALSVTLLDTDDAPAASGQAVLEPAPGELRLWQRVTVVGLFAQELDVASLTTDLERAATEQGLDALPSYRIEGLADTVWEREWLRDFGPMVFGPRFQVVPREYPTAPSTDDRVSLRLDPGLAFGTGTHPTTALCLSWMGQNTAETLTPMSALEVIDYGAGSGILGIAALLLGARRVTAVDIDPQALIAAQDNARLNGVDALLDVVQPEVLEERLSDQNPWPGCDVLLANILHGPLLELGERFARLLKPGGELVLSGLLLEQGASLRVSYTRWFEFKPDVTRDGWLMMTATRRQ